MDREFWKSLHISEATGLQEVSPALHYLLPRGRPLRKWKTMDTLFSASAQNQSLGKHLCTDRRDSTSNERGKRAPIEHTH